MGNPITANYTNLFMGMFETSFLNHFQRKTRKEPLIWVRFTYDICFIWRDGEDLLK